MKRKGVVYATSLELLILKIIISIFLTTDTFPRWKRNTASG